MSQSVFSLHMTGLQLTYVNLQVSFTGSQLVWIHLNEDLEVTTFDAVTRLLWQFLKVSI